MRKCKFKQWVQCEHTDKELWEMFCEDVKGTDCGYILNQYNHGKMDYTLPGTNNAVLEEYKRVHRKYRAEVTFFGYFVDYGLDIEEYDNGGCSFTCAIVEDTDGKLHKVNVDTIEFLYDDYRAEGYKHHETIFGW
ncbi:MAG: hypothetical protein NC247_02040 [Ruminococcus flavefaciens]|nr:hypothetical protein [Ruminococcus flavefaciens]